MQKGDRTAIQRFFHPSFDKDCNQQNKVYKIAKIFVALLADNPAGNGFFLG